MRTSRHAPRHVGRIAISGISAVLMASLAACSGGGSSSTSTGSSASASPASPESALLTSAATTLDSTKAVRLTVSSSDVPAKGTKLVAGSGTMVRSTKQAATGVSAPGSFRGTVSLVLDGTKITVPVISTDGKVYAKVPGRLKYQVMNLAGLGIGDPADLLDPKTGISQVFSKLTDVTDEGTGTVGGTSVRRVEGKIPGSLVGQLLAGADLADPATPVTARLSIDPATRQLRRAVLRGPFFVKGTDSTYTLNLDRYGITVPITAPAV